MEYIYTPQNFEKLCTHFKGYPIVKTFINICQQKKNHKTHSNSSGEQRAK